MVEHNVLNATERLIHTVSRQVEQHQHLQQQQQQDMTLLVSAGTEVHITEQQH